jgi:hypothetical protein
MIEINKFYQIALLSLLSVSVQSMQKQLPSLTDFFTNAIGASVMPLTKIQGKSYASNGTEYFLLSREAGGDDKGTFDAWGGAKDPGENHPNITASRELAEETIYLLGSPKYLMDYLDINNGHTRAIIANRSGRFVVYITEFPYAAIENLINQFHTSRAQASNWKYKEKDLLALISYNTLQQAIANAPRDAITGKLKTPIIAMAHVFDKDGEHYKEIYLRPVFVKSMQNFFRGNPPSEIGKHKNIFFYDH